MYRRVCTLYRHTRGFRRFEMATLLADFVTVKTGETLLTASDRMNDSTRFDASVIAHTDIATYNAFLAAAEVTRLNVKLPSNLSLDSHGRAR